MCSYCVIAMRDGISIFSFAGAEKLSEMSVVSTKRVLAGEQSGETLVSAGSRVGLSSRHIYIYIYACGIYATFRLGKQLIHGLRAATYY